MPLNSPADAVQRIKENLLPSDNRSLQWHDDDLVHRIVHLIEALEYLSSINFFTQREDVKKLTGILDFLKRVKQSYDQGVVAWLSKYSTNQINRELHTITFHADQRLMSSLTRRGFLLKAGATALGTVTAIKLLNWLFEHRSTPQLNRDLQLLSDEELLKALSIYQNPFRKNPEEVLATIRDTDKYGAPRGRESEEGFWIFKWKSTQWQTHNGLDLPTPLDTVVYPVAVGEVVEVRKTWRNTEGWRSGVVVKVRSPHNLLIVYCHLSETGIFVRPGQLVTLTTPLAKTGNTGNVEFMRGNELIRNYCLHIGAWQHGREFDPLILLKPGANFYAEVQKNPQMYLAYFKKLAQTTA